jgi:hypothetical protein
MDVVKKFKVESLGLLVEVEPREQSVKIKNDLLAMVKTQASQYF